MSDIGDTDQYFVEAIVGHRIFNGKVKYRVKWEEYSENDNTWEPIENLVGALDKVEAYMVKNKKEKREIDHIVGCGERNGARYFLVRFKNGTQNEFIDWEAAKEYSLDVMEYFATRLVWNRVEDLNEEGAVGLDQQDNDGAPTANAGASSRSSAPPPPNDIEYEN